MSSRKSSKESTPAQPLLYYQTLIDENIESIQARIVHEKELEADHFQWLLGPDGVNSPRSVGISPAYSQSGGLPALACANDTRILVITFHSTRAYRDGTDGSGTLPRNMKRRALLEDQLLCNPLHTLYAFDLAPLALSLHLHLHLHLTEAVDIQSATKAPDRSIVAAVQVVIADASPIFSDIITSTFTRMLFESSKNKDLTDLVQRAWLCGYLGQYDFGTVKDMFANAPKVDMKKFSVDELNVLQKMAYDTLRQDNMKPHSVTHDIKTRWDSKKEKAVAVSQRYANRITANASNVKVTMAHSSSASYSLPGSAAQVKGRSAFIDVEHNLEGKEITSMTTIGKDAPTRAEAERNQAILSMLQGTLPLFDNHWMKALWFPSQPVDWPEHFSPPPNSPAIEIQEHPDVSLNDSQHKAITKMLSQSSDSHLTLVQGPPGTGKTTVIATYVLSAIQAGQRGIWLMAQSNVAVKNIAEKLVKLGFFNFRLLVSKSFHFDWHEHLYEQIVKNMIVSDRLPKTGALKKALDGSQDTGFVQAVPVINVIIDEASQIEVGQYVPLIKTFGHTLRKLCFIGDDKQLPPHGQDDLGNLQSIFELSHLRESLTFLNTQYRMPPQIGDFISEHVYDGDLKSNPSHVVPSSVVACRFVDVEEGSEQLDADGKSSFNKKEVEAVVLLAQCLQDEGKSYRIITPYDAQRSAIERALEEEGIDWHDKCFNVDSFQGNEDHIIVISVVRSKGLGFLTSTRRTNVMLTRCQRGMYIVSSKAFLEGKGANSLVGMMAAELGKRPGAWLTYKDLEDGKFE